MTLRVIMDNGGAKTHTVNDKAQISHEIEKKTTLDKKCGGALEKRQERTVGNTAKANTTRGSPSAVQRKTAHFSKQQTHSGNADVKSENVSVSTSETKQTAKKIYYFSPESLPYIEGELTDGEDYYFFALVYDTDKKGDEKFIKAFLGKGKYLRYNKKKLAPHLHFITEYIGDENNTVKGLIKLSNLDKILI